MLHYKDLRSKGALLAIVALTALVVVLFGGVQPALAQSGETGNVSAGDYEAGSCSANDLVLGTLAIVQTVEPCTFVGDTGTYIFDATFNAGSNTRYNASMYISLDGASANTGNSCYHDYLNPVANATNSNYNPTYGPFFNAGDGDMCGDVQPNSTIQYRTAAVTIACTDSNSDGVVDAINTCTGWQQNSTHMCQDVTGASIGSPSKCNCGAVPIPAAVIRKIRVDKVTVPAGDTQSFNFTLKNPSGTTLNTFSLTDTATPFVSGVLPAANGYSVAETLPAGWDQTNATCTNGITTYSPTNIDLTPNREVVCTFTNTKRGQIIVDKVTIPSGDLQSFPFALTGGPDSINQSFSLADATAPHNSGLVKPGTYNAAETVPPGWDLTSATCSDGSPVNAISLQANETVTCTFTNTKRGTVTVTKNSVGGDGTFSFASTGGLGATPFSLNTSSGTASITYNNVIPGTYSVTEGAQASPWDFTSLSCTEAGGTNTNPTTTSGQVATIKVDPGETVHCTYTNTKRATIQVSKVTVNQNGQIIPAGHIFDFQINGASPSISPFTLTGGTSSSLYYVRPNQAFSLSEIYDSGENGWQLLTDPTKTYCFGTVSIGTYSSSGTYPNVTYTLAGIQPTPGQAIVCQFTNESSPLGVTLADFSAAQAGDAVLLTWETNSELNNRGFNLYRGTSPTEPPDRQLNELLIPSQSQGNPGGFIYTWEDRADLVAGTAYFYWVEDVDISGSTTMHGPVSVNYTGPTAVTVSSVQANSAATPYAVPFAGILLVLLAPLAGALAVRRRRA